MKLGIVALAALALAGCASVEYSSPGKLSGIDIKGSPGPATRLVRVKTSSFHMFWTVPIACGDVRWDPKRKDIAGGVVFGEDFAGAEEVQTTLLALAESQNADLADVRVDWGDQSFIGVSYQGAVGSCFGLSTFSATAALVPRKGVSK